MRRTVAALVATLSTAAVLTPGLPAQAEPVPSPSPAATSAEERAEEVLETATELLAGELPSTEHLHDSGSAEHGDHAERPGDEGAPADATLALNELSQVLPDLEGAERRRAEALLARPTDGPADPHGDGYALGAQVDKTCGPTVCVHYVTTPLNKDYASPDWAARTREVLEEVWNYTTRLGYRPPLSDGTRGGDGRFDVYLKNIGVNQLYGYCAPEQRAVRSSGYCVLDNDYSPTEYRADPEDSLKVTAIHEFFHAVQFGYDAGEDMWFMESTATWIEDTYADAINDNRSYLRYGQLRRPAASLDTFSSTGLGHYGNWIFWQFLSERYGNGFVRTVWERAEPRSGVDRYSLQALTSALRNRGGFATVFRRYASANAVPGRFYSEGRFWPGPAIQRSWTLGRGAGRSAATRLDHLAARHYRVRPATDLRGKRWSLRVVVNGPARVTAPGAVVTVRRANGSIGRTTVRLSRSGDGRALVAFGRGAVRDVTVTLINGSTRFRSCWTDRTYPVHSCYGVPRDQRQPYGLRVAVVRR